MKKKLILIAIIAIVVIAIVTVIIIIRTDNTKTYTSEEEMKADVIGNTYVWNILSSGESKIVVTFTEDKVYEKRIYGQVERSESEYTIEEWDYKNGIIHIQNIDLINYKTLKDGNLDQYNNDHCIFERVYTHFSDF